jgi:predicted LPLAT superfamily acyltransferase
MRVCAVVPSRNHFRALPHVVQGLRAAGLRVFIVDDGSDAPARAAIARLHRPDDGVTVFRIEVNQGKGGAVLQGFELAAAEGFTHALQIDADGQHDLGAVAPMLAAARATPDALIVGMPVYDQSIPTARRIGRWITHFWVCVELLRTSVVDAMCGLRVYPLAAVQALLTHERIARGMDFDIDVLVRLAWRGTPLRQVQVRVTYPADNTSNFDVWRDNLRISRAHTKLVLAMPFRLGAIWRQREAGKQQARHWSAMAERGMQWGLQLSAGLYRLLGLRGSMIALTPVILYFYLTGHEQRLASQEFLHRAFAAQGIARVPGWRDRWRHFRSFTQKALETFAAWLDRTRLGPAELSDTTEIDALAASGRGVVMIVSHLGNAEFSRAVLDPALRARIVVLVHTRHAESYNRVLQRFRPEAAFNALQVDEIGPDTILAMKDLVDRGFWVTIAGDRTPIHEGERVSQAPFLGKSAPFPQGPYILAHLLGCPVYLLFCLREAGRHRIFFESFAEQVALPRGGRDQALAGLVARYAARLEAYCLRDPFQWYNFFDFWAQKRAPEVPARS